MNVTAEHKTGRELRWEWGACHRLLLRICQSCADTDGRLQGNHAPEWFWSMQQFALNKWCYLIHTSSHTADLVFCSCTVNSDWGNLNVKVDMEVSQGVCTCQRREALKTYQEPFAAPCQPESWLPPQ